MTTRLVVVGAGGFGRETLDVVDAVNRGSGSAEFEVLGVLDDAPSAENLGRLCTRGIANLGSVGAWLRAGDDADYLIAVGSSSARRELAEKFDSLGLRPATVVHPQAVVGSAGSIGGGTIICSGVQVSTNVHLGRHVHLNPNATVGHDSTVGDFVSVNPAATISGECTIGHDTLIGSAAVILQALDVGTGSVVGASACVTRNVARGVVVKGVPAR